jgi:hypothetical protein
MSQKKGLTSDRGGGSVVIVTVTQRENGAMMKECLVCGSGAVVVAVTWGESGLYALDSDGKVRHSLCANCERYNRTIPLSGEIIREIVL